MPFWQKEKIMHDGKLNAEALEQRLIESQMENAQEILNEMFATPGISALELLEALNRDAWKPLLSRLVINRKGKLPAAAPIDTTDENEDESPEQKAQTTTQTYTGKKRGRKPKVKTEPDLENVPMKNRATFGGGDKRKVVIFTPEQKEKQKELIWKTVNANQKQVTTPQIIKTVKNSYPDINDSVVRDMVKDLVSSKVLSALKRKGAKTKAIKYTVGNVAL